VPSRIKQRHAVRLAEWMLVQIVAAGFLLFTDWLSYHPTKSKLALALVPAVVVPALVYLLTYLAPLSRYRDGRLRLVRLLTLVASLGLVHYIAITQELKFWAILSGALLLLLIAAAYLNSTTRSAPMKAD
jgi:uncharacterized membrane protein